MAANWKILLSAGVAAVAIFMLFLRSGNDQPETTPVSIVDPAPVLPEKLPERLRAQPPQAFPDPNEDIDLADLANDPAIADAPEFDDANYPEPVDDLLVLERGDPTRYITPQSREEDRLRRQRVREGTLQAERLIGDERVRALTTLGAFAGEGNEEAATRLRAMLTSADDELRADALDAVTELLPGNDIVPDYNADPLTDEQAALIVNALKGRPDT